MNVIGDPFRLEYLRDAHQDALRGLAEMADAGDGTATQVIGDLIKRSTGYLLSASECHTYHGYVRQQVAAEVLGAVGPFDAVNTLREALSLQYRMIGTTQYMSKSTVRLVQERIDRAIRAIQGRNPTAKADVGLSEQRQTDDTAKIGPQQHPTSALGIVFNIDDLGGGSYGAVAWRIFMRNLRPENIICCRLKEGDTEETLNGRQREFCIAVFGLAPDDKVVSKAFENCDEKGLAPLARRFISSPELEPLVDAGLIDSLGRLVQDEWSRMFHDRCKDCGWGFAPKAVGAYLTPELKAELESLRNKTVS